MKLFKLFLLLPLALLFITSCGGDDDGVVPDLTGDFPGTYTGTVVVNEDGLIETSTGETATLTKDSNTETTVSFTSDLLGTFTFPTVATATALTGSATVTDTDGDTYAGGAVISGGKLTISLISVDDASLTVTFTED